MITWQEADARGMIPCSECAGWENVTQQQHEQQTVMLAAGKGKCFHTNELCPALQWGHRLCSKLEARTRMKYKCSHCEQQEMEPTWRVQAVESPVKYKKHEAGEDIGDLRSWCMKRGLPAHGQKADLIRRLQRHEEQDECAQCMQTLSDVCSGCRQCRSCLAYDGQAWCGSCSRCRACCACTPPAYVALAQVQVAGHDQGATAEEQQQQLMPAIPEDREVDPLDMQTIWKQVRSILGKRKQCTIAPAQAHGSKECKKLGAYVARTTGNTRVVVAPDTCAEVSMIREGAEDASWTEIEAPPVTAQGLSSSTTDLDRLVGVPMIMRSGAQVHVVMCRVTPESRMPDGVDLFLGTAAQHRLGAKVDVKNDRMELWDANMVIDLEPVSKLRKRMRQRPQNVIDICSGMSGARAVMADLGYNIGHWLAVENNGRVAEAGRCDEAFSKITGGGAGGSTRLVFCRTKLPAVQLSKP
jgi:hypothetical protein